MSAADNEFGGARLLTALAVVAVCVQLVGLYQPATPPQPVWFPGVDKLEHALIFALPVLLIMLARRRFSWPVVVVFALHGVVSELIQHYFYAHRTGDVWDVVADLTGVAVGSAVFASVTAAWARATSPPVGAGRS